VNNYKLIADHGLQIEYQTFGSGKKTLLCFHGFGRECSDFLPFEKSLGSLYTIHSVNLFYHGNSTFPDTRLERRPLEKEELQLFFELIKQAERFDRFSMAGYSLGGKVVLTLAEIYPEKIDELFLMAPDGIKANPWYYFASQTTLGQRLNKKSIQYPWIFDTFISFSRKFGFASKKQAQFAKAQMGNSAKRLRVYKIWMTHRKLKPNLKLLVQLIKQNEIKTTFFMGKHERVIPIKPIEQFVNKLGSFGKLIMLDCGHQIDFGEVGKLIALD
jgi:pimeloyl-ACP methyl ester carboxylesterase